MTEDFIGLQPSLLHKLDLLQIKTRAAWLHNYTVAPLLYRVMSDFTNWKGDCFDMFL